jgi:murein DD-endopeptidase MepM/ murein hydrolase activator NlpD
MVKTHLWPFLVVIVAAIPDFSVAQGDWGYGDPGGFPVIVPPGAYIESDFGTKQDPPESGPGLNAWSTHRGIDFRAPPGSSVIAPTSGEVKMAIRRGTYGGGLLVIESPILMDVGKLMAGATPEFSYYDTVTVKVSHLDRVYKEEGEWVEAGELVGAVAADVEHPIVHLETWTGGTLLNPHYLWLDGTGIVTCFDPARAPYPRDRFFLLAPVPCA